MAELTNLAPARNERQVLAKVIAFVVGLIVVIEGGIGLAAVHWGVQDWNLVNAALGNLNTLAVLLTGGLLALAKPISSP